MAFSVRVHTPYGVDVINNVVDFGPEEKEKNQLLILGEDNKPLAVYAQWVSAVKEENYESA